MANVQRLQKFLMKTRLEIMLTIQFTLERLACFLLMKIQLNKTTPSKLRNSRLRLQNLSLLVPCRQLRSLFFLQQISPCQRKNSLRSSINRLQLIIISDRENKLCFKTKKLRKRNRLWKTKILKKQKKRMSKIRTK